VYNVCVYTCLCIGTKAAQREGRCTRLWAVLQHRQARPGRHHCRGQYRFSELLFPFSRTSTVLVVVVVSDQLGWPSLSNKRLNSRLRIFLKSGCWTCGYKHWWFGSTLKADSSFWSWSLLYYSGCSYWCIQVFCFFSSKTIHDWNSLDTLSRSKLIPQSPVDISCC